MGGGEYTQSTALLRYAGKLGGLYPDDALLALQVRIRVRPRASLKLRATYVLRGGLLR